MHIPEKYNPKTEVLYEAGAYLRIYSYENDGDAKNISIVPVDDVENLDSIITFLGFSRSGKLGNSLYEDAYSQFDEYTNSILEELFKFLETDKYWSSKLKEIEFPKEEKERTMQMIDWIYTEYSKYLGGPFWEGYFSRVCEKIEIMYIPTEVIVESAEINC
jgi:hypothetical protein